MPNSSKLIDQKGVPELVGARQRGENKWIALSVTTTARSDRRRQVAKAQSGRLAAGASDAAQPLTGRVIGGRVGKFKRGDIMANEEQLAILRQGVEAWNAWREKNPTLAPDLTDANLAGANLRWADLTWTSLRAADLSQADLTGANLSQANLNGANLGGAKLGGANLSQADLTGANLSGATMPDGTKHA
jgi:hypothetical protein